MEKLYRLVRCVNGGELPLADVGEANGLAIALVWTVLREDEIFGADGEPHPVHFQNAFVEDAMHDWGRARGMFRYYAHSSEKGDNVLLLIILRPVAPELAQLKPGQHGFAADADPANRGIFRAKDAFNIIVFQTAAKKDGTAKRGKAAYRIKVLAAKRDAGFLRAQEVCRSLDSGWIPPAKSEEFS